MKHTVQIPDHIVIPEPQYTITLCLDLFRSRLVSHPLQGALLLSISSPHIVVGGAQNAVPAFGFFSGAPLSRGSGTIRSAVMRLRSRRSTLKRKPWKVKL
ncbi:hypothetical protein HMPREF9695_03715 [Afipia broomeae ATCC 49717]|uniref:Uncharacterized protein n=1 Tax=Afipia broomeae ATCC 49717 TaxID=883078 RepID=K8P434_9BRAD|nr:hypothetical protein HMPREF9695_03715 [Afipia broomeae ATCC 49717]